MTYRLSILHADGARERVASTIDDLGEACRQGLLLAEELGAQRHPPLPHDTFVEVLDTQDAMLIAIGLIRPRGRED